ncbi:hypothetical protein CK203_015842 [Vitis vinifera]|uniref:Uncharacterized protein n=1 Tax=Vitis vinifera TaxID=29760 RepID=A0A438JRH8_VITVI|nr:hypothetical protein CK203_015842 [Vitis vinifera]
MDGHVILNTQGVLDSVVAPAKGIRTGCPDAPSDGFISHGEKEIYKSVGLFLGIKRLPGDPFSSSCEGIYIQLQGTVPLINGEEIFSVVMMTIGVMGCGPWLLVVIALLLYRDFVGLLLVILYQGRYPFFFFGAVFGTYLFATAVPLVAFAGSLHLLSGLLGHCFGRVILLWLCGKKWLQKRLFRLSGPGERGGGYATEKGGKNDILFTKEQFNAGLRFPLPALFKEFLHFSQIPPIFIHPNLVRCVRSPALPSNGDRTARFDKGRGEGAGGSLGWMGGAIAASVEAFFSELYPKNSGLELRGHLVDWVEKASFACVCKLFEIDPKERAYKTLLSARNLTEVVREPQEYVINILPRKLAKDEIVPGEHYTVKELPLYQEAKEADAEKRRKLLEDRDQKKTEGTIRKAPGQKRGPDSPPKKTSGKRGSW